MEANGQSHGASISADGRYVAFQSEATNLVLGDTNGDQDIFVKDMLTGTTTRVSTDSLGVQADSLSYSQSFGPSISADGRYVAFCSYATNLVGNDTNGEYDIFLKDTQTGTTMRVSVDSSENQTTGSTFSRTSISSDGRYVAFRAYASNLVSGDTNGVYDIFVRDTVAGTTTRVNTDSSGNQADRISEHVSISADGRYVAFTSSATNLISGDTNGGWDVFVKDTQTGTTTRVSTDSAGNEANSGSYGSVGISADGRYVTFVSGASNLVSGDSNEATDIFIKDRLTGTTTRISTNSSGTEADLGSGYPSISADGRHVAFESYATNLVNGDTNIDRDIFVKDTQTDAVTTVSVRDIPQWGGNDDSDFPCVSADGRYVAFVSDASNLVMGDTNGRPDVFLRDTQTGTTIRASTDSSGVEGDSDSGSPSISADGRYVAFESLATNLVSDDTNGHRDVFVKDTLTGTTTRVSTNASGSQGDSVSQTPSISADGRYVAFVSYATNLVSDDTNGKRDIFVKDTLSVRRHGSARILQEARQTTTPTIRASVPTAVTWYLKATQPTWSTMIPMGAPTYSSKIQ